MSVDSTDLQRATLERKDKEELTTIAAALGLKASPASKKADLVDLILKASGGPAVAPRRRAAPTQRSATPSPSRATTGRRSPPPRSPSPTATSAEDADAGRRRRRRRPSARLVGWAGDAPAATAERRDEPSLFDAPDTIGRAVDPTPTTSPTHATPRCARPTRVTWPTRSAATAKAATSPAPKPAKPSAASRAQRRGRRPPVRR